MKKVKLRNVAMMACLAVITVFSSCNKDNGNELNSTKIEEIVYCKPDLSEVNMQPKIAIKAKNITLITYEYAGAKKDSASCIFYYDKEENLGHCIVFSPNKITQYILSGSVLNHLIKLFP